MDLREAILKEHSKQQIIRIANHIGNNKTTFAKLMVLFFTNEYLIAQRAAWVMSYCVTNYPALILPHLEALIDNLYQSNLHNAAKRNTFRILQYIPIPEQLMGKLATNCFNVLSDKKEAVAIKVFAMSTLMQIVKSHPELKNELKLIIEEQMPHASAAFKSRGKKVLNELNKIKV